MERQEPLHSSLIQSPGVQCNVQCRAQIRAPCYQLMLPGTTDDHPGFLPAINRRGQGGGAPGGHISSLCDPRSNCSLTHDSPVHLHTSRHFRCRCHVLRRRQWHANMHSQLPEINELPPPVDIQAEQNSGGDCSCGAPLKLNTLHALHTGNAVWSLGHEGDTRVTGTGDGRRDGRCDIFDACDAGERLVSGGEVRVELNFGRGVGARCDLALVLRLSLVDVRLALMLWMANG